MDRCTPFSLNTSKRVLAFIFTALLAHTLLFAADEPFRIDYSVEISSIDDQLFHVVADVKNIHDTSLEFSLPMWSPGWYTVENYARNVSRLIFKSADGKRLNHERTHKQSWRVDTRGLAALTIEFDYRATKLALNQAKIENDFAFFTGTELFLMAEGHRDAPSTLRLKLPTGWRSISALKDTDTPHVFTASNYDELVDGPVLMGSFDARQFTANGKPHWLVTVPKGIISDPRAAEITTGLAKVVKPAADLFGGTPYDKYLFFYFLRASETRAAGGLEHANSHVCFFSRGAGTSQTVFEFMAAHEYFHVWNAKRIRPAQLWPYDYSREVETPLLWVSEGFTSYYENVTLYRAGLISRDEFYEGTAASIAHVEGNPAREFLSPAESSTSTWLNYDNHTTFEISYYITGRNLAALLDISLRHDTNGARGLDDVMRALYANYFQKNKGFETRDLLAEINAISGRDYADFFAKYVNGVERPQYSEIFKLAGLTLVLKPRRDAFGNMRTTLSDDPIATDAQKKIRDAWLKK
ncbi:MAG: hypothetical protein WCT04_03375 [Planctomycetota bacterium]